MTPEPVVVVVEGAEETERLAATVADLLASGEIVHLQGGLGSGKTTFVRGLAAGLGIEEGAVSSPTFVRLQRYDGPARSIVHVDAYRIERDAEAEGLEIEAIAEETDAIVAIEWPERLGRHLPAPDLVVSIDASRQENRRRIAILDRRDETSRRRLDDALRTLHAATIERGPAGSAARCPICGRPVESSAEPSPFCSQRCRGADLSRWFRGSYSISRPLDPEEDSID